jgi:protein TonB
MNKFHLCKSLFLLFFFGLTTFSAFSQKIGQTKKRSLLDAPEVSGKVRAVVKTKVEKNDKILEFVDQMPEFPGGEEGLFDYIQKNLKYPQQAVDSNTTGRVTINFVVNADGSITDVKLARGIGNGCDEEAIKVVKGLPRWNPGKRNGKKVRVAYSLPITFQLD